MSLPGDNYFLVFGVNAVNRCYNGCVVKGVNTGREIKMTKVEIMENIVSIQYMHEKVMGIGNEYAEELWFMDYPDGADYDDIKEMAKDSQIMEWLHETFSRIMKLHAKGKL